MPLLQTLSSSFGVADPAQDVFVVPLLTTVDEGQTITFNIYTNGVAEGTTLYYNTSGTINSSDTSQSLTGQLTVAGSAANVSFPMISDNATEGTETIGLELRFTPGGPIVGQSDLVQVIDTSTAPYGSVVVLGRNTAAGSNNLTTTAYWTVPAGVTSISLVAVGAGSSGTYTDVYLVGSGGGGGALSYRNNISVTPGDQLTFTMGWPTQCGYYYQPGNTIVTKGGQFIIGAQPGKMAYMGVAGTQSGTANSSPALRIVSAAGATIGGSGYNANSHGGGQGGLGGSGYLSSYRGGGGGAGGYGAAGGNGGTNGSAGGSATLGAGGGGGSGTVNKGGAGGGANLFGDTTSYSGGSNTSSSGGLGGGGTAVTTLGGANANGVGSLYGGGGAAAASQSAAANLYSNYIGSRSAVRIVFPGISRQFPSTDVANPANTINISA